MKEWRQSLCLELNWSSIASDASCRPKPNLCANWSGRDGSMYFDDHAIDCRLISKGPRSPMARK
jgi:hypothetical protein